MASTTENLTDQELAALRKAARGWTSPQGWFRGIDASEYVEGLLALAVHPIVLAEPEAHQLSWSDAGDGWTTVTFRRPKKKGLGARTELRLAPDQSFARAFIDHVRGQPVSVRTIERLIAAVGEAAGIVGRVSPRTLRHTSGVLQMRTSRNPAVVQKRLNVSDRILRHYVRLSNEEADRAVVGFLPPLEGTK